MDDLEKKILDDIVEKEIKDGTDPASISITVYDFAFCNFNPAPKNEVDQYLRDKRLPTLADNDPKLPSRPNNK